MKATYNFVTDPETGRIYPIPAGGSGEADPPSGDVDPAESEEEDGEAESEDEGGAGSKRAVLADLAKERKARQKLEADLSKIQQQHETEQEKAIREAAEKAREEALAEVGSERLQDRVRVAAAKQLNDPEDAVRLLDLDQLDPSSKTLDQEIASQLKQLVESKPYLAAKVGGSGSGDAGSRSTSPSNKGDMNAAIRAAAGR